MGISPLRARAVALALVISTGTAQGAELLHIPFDCTLAAGRVRLLPTSGDRTYALLGAHDRQVFTTCSPSEPDNCRNWLVHRFAFECEGARVTWLEAAGSAARGENWDAWVEDGRFNMRMTPGWAVAPARYGRRAGGWQGRFAASPGFDPYERNGFRAGRIVTLPPGFAPAMGIPLTFSGAGDAPVALAPNGSRSPDGYKSNDWAPQTADSYAPPLGQAGADNRASSAPTLGAANATARAAPPLPAPPVPERAPRGPAPAPAEKTTAAAPAAPKTATAAPAAPTPPGRSQSDRTDAAPLLGKAEPEPATGPNTSPQATGTNLEPKILNAPARAATASPTIAHEQGAAAPQAPATAPQASATAPEAPATAPQATTVPEPVVGLGPATSMNPATNGPATMQAADPAGSGQQIAAADEAHAAPSLGETAALPTAVTPAGASGGRELLSGAIAAASAAAVLALLSVFAFAFWRRGPSTALVRSRDISAISLERTSQPSPQPVSQPALGSMKPQRPGGSDPAPNLGAPNPAAPDADQLSLAPVEDLPVPTSYEEALKVLGAAPEASIAAVKKIVDGMRQSWHPDHAGSEADRLYRERRLQQINVAWDLVAKRRSVAA